ncbi:fasciclin domain-containing protein [Pontibacter sp. E15-1]|uniref:fasciclin domain-containing protein n=1 Tax=Pontibacter sp. E15-1 TaxID=2919918 RepID=UPI001F4FA65C|nr:fasciclin domain-containing protein [Pontibacter sp. E15-1]MCJ8163756.1 fasciclin domain-containing protein [Pontibacter sp. E15-1]
MKSYRHPLSILFAVAAMLLVLCMPTALADRAAAGQTQRTTLMQYIMQERPVLASLITKAGLTPILSDNNPYTLLAPPEAELKALEQLPTARLRAILSGHILKGIYQESDFKDGATLETLARTKITIYRKKNYTLIDGVRLEKPATQLENGILHSLAGKLAL